MKEIQIFVLILSFCGLTLSEPTCEYQTIDSKIVCLMSDSATEGEIKVNTTIQNSDVHRVTTKDAADQKLINAVLTKFTSLKIFQIPEGKIDVITPDDFENCPESLIEIQISNGDLSIIPDETIANCVNLETVDLSKNKLSKVTKTSFPIKVEKLILSNNQIKMKNSESTLFFNNSILKDLTTLDLSGNSIDTLDDSILPTQKLTYLDFSNNKINKIPDNYFDHNENLDELNLQNNQLTSISDTIFKKLTKLKVLKISSNYINKTDPTAFAENKLLEYLDMSDNPITTLDENLLKNLTALKTLNLQEIKITATSSNAINKTLLPLTNLENLDISKNTIGTVEGLFTKNDKLKELNIGSMNLSEFKGEVFGALTKLENLNFDDNKIEELPENIFEKTKEMKSLSARNNKIVKLKASTFSNMENLETLDFSGNPINEIEETFFDKLTKLKIVKFEGNECINKTFDDFKLTDEMRVTFKKCFDNYNSAHSVVISNVLFVFVLIFKFI